jgi:hypothetical protein
MLVHSLQWTLSEVAELQGVSKPTVQKHAAEVDTVARETIMPTDQEIIAINRNDHDNGKSPWRRVGVVVGAAAVIIAAVVGASVLRSNGDVVVAPSYAAGPITIETSLASGWDPTQPASGTFEVAEGADTLGCTTGTWEDTRNDEPGDLQSVSKLMTCSEGNTGTFTINYIPGAYDTGTPGSSDGPWHIEDATADFDGLQGEGDYSTVGEAEILTGDIEYTS